MRKEQYDGLDEPTTECELCLKPIRSSERTKSRLDEKGRIHTVCEACFNRVIEEAIEEYVAKGWIIPTGETRNGKTVYKSLIYGCKGWSDQAGVAEAE